jgi:hypothetical protein
MKLVDERAYQRLLQIEWANPMKQRRSLIKKAVMSKVRVWNPLSFRNPIARDLESALLSEHKTPITTSEKYSAISRIFDDRLQVAELTTAYLPLVLGGK